MAWVKVKREDHFEGNNRAFISISRTHIAFNSIFVRQANIKIGNRVTIYIDDEDLKLGFEFHNDERENSFALTRTSGDKKGTKRQGLNCSASGFVAKYEWIRSVTRHAVKDRRFFPRKEGNKWVIQLRPSFEYRKARESGEIASDISGIYRYLREDGEVVYIGRGAIRNRLGAPERRDWDFDVVEYSVINDPDLQVKWEDYWIERYIEEHGGKFPPYNRQSGDSQKRKTRR